MENNPIISPENVVYQKPTLMNDNHMHYCPGCSHGVVHKLVAEIIEEMGLTDKAVGISPVGCAVFAYNYIDIDWQEAAHGRAPALASAIKRLWPDRLVFTYQGDGDLACIGTAESIHALNRGENIAIIFINNAIYGMTGGQMAPTTLMGMKTATCPYGRLPFEVRRHRRSARRHMLRHTTERAHRGGNTPCQEGNTPGIRQLHEPSRLIARGNRINMQQRMEDDARTGQQVDGREHAPLLPTRRSQEHHRQASIMANWH